jgi:hypothetical protein
MIFASLNPAARQIAVSAAAEGAHQLLESAFSSFDS